MGKSWSATSWFKSSWPDPNSKFGFLEVFEMLIAIFIKKPEEHGTFVTLSFGDLKMGPFFGEEARNIIQGKRQRAKVRHVFSPIGNRQSIHILSIVFWTFVSELFLYVDIKVYMFDVLVHGWLICFHSTWIFQRIFLSPKVSNSRLCCSPEILMLNHFWEGTGTCNH